MPEKPSTILFDCIQSVPPGAWAVGVSGGADSVGLLSLLRRRSDLRLHVAHLNHQLRGSESDADALFVQELASQWKLASTVRCRAELESEMTGLPGNASSRYRVLRFEFFRRVVEAEGLDGVILAHHGDDEAETVLHRLLRGSGVEGLAPMSFQTLIGSLLVLRPLYPIRRVQLREYLRKVGQGWREDSSNATDVYARNRLRAFLASRPEVTERLLAVSRAARGLREWVGRQAPRLEARFAARELADLPAILARESARRWLVAVGVPPGELKTKTIERLIEMAADAASPPSADFPGGVTVRRRRQMLWAQLNGSEKSDGPDPG